MHPMRYCWYSTDQPDKMPLNRPRQFTEATQVNALAITKLDGTAKGGVVIGISDQFKIPVKYIGIGEKLEDLQIFDKTCICRGLVFQDK